MEVPAFHRMRLVIPLLYLGADFTDRGRSTAWRTAIRLAREFPEVTQNLLFWPAVLALTVLPRCTYGFFQNRFYRSHRWPARFLNLLAKVRLRKVQA
jgi:hypothetical protein